MTSSLVLFPLYCMLPIAKVRGSVTVQGTSLMRRDPQILQHGDEEVIVLGPDLCPVNLDELLDPS